MKNIKIKNLVLKVAAMFVVATSLSVLNGVNDSNVAFAMENNNIEEKSQGIYSSVNSDLYGYFDKAQHFDFNEIVVCAKKVNKVVHEALEFAESIGKKIKNNEKYKQQLVDAIRSGGQQNKKIMALFLPVVRKLSLANKYVGKMIKAVEKSGFNDYVDRLCELEIKSSDEVYLKEYGKLKNKVLEVARIMFEGFDLPRGLQSTEPSFTFKGHPDLVEYMEYILELNGARLGYLSSCNKRLEQKLEKLYNKFFIYGVLGADYSELKDLEVDYKEKNLIFS